MGFYEKVEMKFIYISPTPPSFLDLKVVTGRRRRSQREDRERVNTQGQMFSSSYRGDHDSPDVLYEAVDCVRSRQDVRGEEGGGPCTAALYRPERGVHSFALIKGAVHPKPNT